MAIGDKKKALMEGSTTAAMVGAAPAGLDSDKAVYVNVTGSDETGDGTSSAPYATIQHAINSLPKLLNGKGATVFVSEGTYNENIDIKGFVGSLSIVCGASAKIVGNVLCQGNNYARINSANIEGVVTCGEGSVRISECNIATTNPRAIIANSNCVISVTGGTVTATGSASNQGAIHVENALGMISRCTISENTPVGVSAWNGGVAFLTSVINNATQKTGTYHGKIVS